MPAPSLDQLLERFVVKPGKPFRLEDHDPAWAGDADVPEERRKKIAQELLTEDVSELARAQELLYAADQWSVLVVFQAMDAAGKDGTIKHVMSGVNPQGCQVFSFKQPSAEELDHNFLWRYSRCLPERGRIGIFNRSYYEEVLVVRVHPEWIGRQRIPGSEPADPGFWKHRYHDINEFEHHLAPNGTLILKFFLNISRKEQRKRFLKRLNEPGKLWKFDLNDVAERGHWDDHMKAYQEAIEATSTEWAPWHVVPADKKWVTRSVVAALMSRAIEGLDLRFPEVDDKLMKQYDEARRALETEG